MDTLPVVSLSLSHIMSSIDIIFDDFSLVLVPRLFFGHFPVLGLLHLLSELLLDPFLDGLLGVLL